ncbi:hypothetical protein V5799_002651 [Amblyomma americanum]|uniref:Uncharacterized protein n=1 Tax=Amblyomma americanum TaxID=6943 RepID=A0AAQ4DB72_AMBAM
MRFHDLKTAMLCWCETESATQIDVGEVVQRYIIEIEVFAWDSFDPRNEPLNFSFMGLHPMFDNEEMLCFIRCQGSNIRLTIPEIAEITRMEVNRHYTTK